MPKLRDGMKAPSSTSIRPSLIARDLWDKLATYFNVSRGQVFEMAIRCLARREGFFFPGMPEDTPTIVPLDWAERDWLFSEKQNYYALTEWLSRHPDRAEDFHTGTGGCASLREIRTELGADWFGFKPVPVPDLGNKPPESPDMF